MLSTVRTGAPFSAALEIGVRGLADRDRRLAHEIAAGVLRARSALDARLKPLVAADWQRVPPALKDTMRIGAYQILNLGRVPVHAAVETSVELARTSMGERPAGMVNAVLRRLATEKAERRSAPPGSHPAWMVQRWERHYGKERTAALVAHNDSRPPLVIQPARWSLEKIAGALAAGGIAFEPVAGGQGLSIHGARVADLPGYREGGFIVQDAAQASVLEFAGFPEGEPIWDACAAPGGKAVMLSREHRVLASDASRERLARLGESARRAGCGVFIFAADARYPPFGAGTLPAILLDAPCSATGTLARHPDARWRLTMERVERLAVLQSALLHAVAEVLRIGGTLVYATCSLEPEENEGQVTAFLAAHQGFARTRADLHLLPGESPGDGAYAARLERTA